MQNDINEYLTREQMSLTDWEKLLLIGWDRVGDYFFHRRFDYYSIPFIGNDVVVSMQLMPMRYRLFPNFSFTKSQRINMRLNNDLVQIYRPATITDEKLELFDLWYAQRFNKLASLETWISDKEKPFSMYELCLYKYDRLVGCSFLQLFGEHRFLFEVIFDVAVEFVDLAFFDFERVVGNTFQEFAIMTDHQKSAFEIR